MTVETFSYHPEPNVLTRFWDGLVRFVEAVAEGRAMEARYYTLAHMSNGELAKIGLSRKDIAAASLKPLDL